MEELEATEAMGYMIHNCREEQHLLDSRLTFDVMKMISDKSEKKINSVENVGFCNAVIVMLTSQYILRLKSNALTRR